jgi:LuxR family transcriptional regulator, maltose regulon positive regulatory protein
MQLVDTARYVGGATLVLDGLDGPHQTSLVDDMSIFVQHLPRNIRVVVTQRSRRLATCRRLAPDDIGVLDQADLAFTAEEARWLIHAASGHDLTDRQLRTLLAQTEGWAVGLRFAVVGLRSTANADEYIESFSGDEPHVAAYFHTEVLAGQSGHARRFLVRTSALDRLSGPLCGLVTGEPAAGVMLRLLEQRGAFVRRVDSSSDWFVVHPLLRDVLRRELRISAPGQEIEALVTAAAWLLERDEYQAAADYLIRAEDWGRVIALVDRYGRLLFERGAADIALGWLDAIPASWAPGDHHLALRRAFLHSMLGQTHKAEQVVHDLAGRRPTRGEQVVLAALRAGWASFDATPRAVMAAAEVVLREIDELNPDEIPNVFGITSRMSLRAMAAGSRGRALWYRGDIAAARDALSAVAQQHGVYPPWLTHVVGALALLEAWSGNLRMSDHLARRALRIASGAGLLGHPATLDARLAIACIARERGHQHTANSALEHAYAIATRTRRPVTRAIHTVERALWHLADRHPERGLDEIYLNRVAGEPPPPPIVAARLRAVEVRLLLALGRTEHAQAIINASGWPMPSGLLLPAVQASLAAHDVAAARSYLEPSSADEAEPRHELERDLGMAMVELEAGNRRAALEQGAPLVERARGDAHVRLFLDPGRPAERLLRALLNLSPSPYLWRVVRQAESGASEPRTDILGLSERELEVVRYLPTSLSSSEIAARLFISLNTLKTHLRTIYRKLGVHGRREAVDRARQLGIG